MPDYLRTLANKLKYEHFPTVPWTQVCKAVADIGHDLLKTDIMHHSQLTYPDFSPAAPRLRSKKCSPSLCYQAPPTRHTAVLSLCDVQTC